MHTRLLFMLAPAVLLLPSATLAQGRLIPRPCVQVPPPCIDCSVRPAPCPAANPIERTSSHVRVTLADRVLRYEVSETFVNHGPALGEADYVFPMPKGAAFEDLKLSINGELVSGETMTAGEARRIYEEIVRRSKDPALVEWMGHGLLRTRIFPIQPGEEKRVVVRFQSVIEREGNALRVDYVRGTPPRGQHGPIARPVPIREEGHDRRPEREPSSTFILEMERVEDLGQPYSPTHTLAVNDRGRRRIVTASGDGSEVTILLPLRRPNAASLNVLAHAKDGENGFALVTITPPAAPRRTTPRDVSFVVDVSGSMRGQKLEQAKAAGRELLESLRSEDRFRIIDFSTDVRSFRDQWTPVTDANVRAARRYVDDLRAEGSTNISGALEEALDTRSSDGRMPLVVFVTDGEPTVGERNPDAIASMASRLRRNARVFTFGVSAEVNASLIEQLALEGHGTAHFVKGGESVERAVSVLANRLTSPIITDLRLRAQGVRLLQSHPSGAIDLFDGQDLVILTRYSGSGEATLRLEGQSATGPVSWTTTARFPERERDNAFVARLWAAQRLGWLAAEKRRNGGTTELDSEIRELGERYGIPTEFSSYLVLEPGVNVNVARTAGGPVTFDRAAAPAPANASSDALARRRETVNALGQVVVTGTAGAAEQERDARFDDAKKSAAQREVKSLAQVDSIVASSAGTSVEMRRVGERTFRLVSGVWTDVRHDSKLRTVRVKPYSEAYFDLVSRLDGLSAAFTLGDRVVVVGRSIAIELAPDGLERVSARELASIGSAW